MNNPWKFELDRSILTCLNYRNDLTVSYRRTDGLTLIVEKLRFWKLLVNLLILYYQHTYFIMILTNVLIKSFLSWEEKVFIGFFILWGLWKFIFVCPHFRSTHMLYKFGQYFYSNFVYLNKNDNIHKNEVQDIWWSDEYWQV